MPSGRRPGPTRPPCPRSPQRTGGGGVRPGGPGLRGPPDPCVGFLPHRGEPLRGALPVGLSGWFPALVRALEEFEASGPVFWMPEASFRSGDGLLEVTAVVVVPYGRGGVGLEEARGGRSAEIPSPTGDLPRGRARGLLLGGGGGPFGGRVGLVFRLSGGVGVTAPPPSVPPPFLPSPRPWWLWGWCPPPSRHPSPRPFLPLPLLPRLLGALPVPGEGRGSGEGRAVGRVAGLGP